MCIKKGGEQTRVITLMTRGARQAATPESPRKVAATSSRNSTPKVTTASIIIKAT